MGSAQSTVQLKVFDWNRFSSNKSLGNITISLGSLTVGTFYDEWRSLDTQGECRVIIHLAPLGIAKPEALAARLSSARLQLENTVYYPGQIVRGCFVFGTQQLRKYHSIRIMIEGYSRTHWSTGSGKNRRHYYGAAMLLNCTAAMAGSPVDKKDTFVLGPSVNLYPFEYVLPLNIPHTYEPNGPIGSFGCPNVISYRAVGFADVASKANKVAIQSFRVLAHPSHVRLDYSHLQMAPVTKTSNMQLEISGPTTAWVGEAYQLSVKVENRSDKPIEYLQVRLKNTRWLSAKNAWGWLRTGGVWVPSEKWNCSNLPGLPIAPGQSWSGTVQVNIPAGLIPSLHSSQSPIIQNAYRIGVKLATAGNIFTKTAGSKRFMIIMSDRYREFEHLVAPVEAEGPLGKLISAPAPPELSSKLIPAVSTDPKVVTCAGQKFGSIAAYPGAFYPVQAIVPYIFQCTLGKTAYPKVTEWTQGTPPTWLRPGTEGLNLTLSPEELATIDYDTPEPSDNQASSSAPV